MLQSWESPCSRDPLCYTTEGVGLREMEWSLGGDWVIPGNCLSVILLSLLLFLSNCLLQESQEEVYWGSFSPEVSKFSGGALKRGGSALQCLLKLKDYSRSKACDQERRLAKIWSKHRSTVCPDSLIGINHSANHLEDQKIKGGGIWMVCVQTFHR